jgi:hypothetical protein
MGTLFLLSLSVAATAAATQIATSSGDFHATTSAGQSSLVYHSDAVYNQGSSQVEVMGAAKGGPSSRSDGSQSVTVDLFNPGGVQFSAIVWGWADNTVVSQAFLVTPSSPTGLISSGPMWFAGSQLASNTYYTVDAWLPPNAGIRGVRVN